MRLVELGKGELQLVKKEVDHCIDEVNLLCFLLRDELANTGVIVTGVDVYSGENAHRQRGCKDCGKFIFSSEIFDSVEEFNKKFWESFLSEQKSEDLLKNLANFNLLHFRKLFYLLQRKMQQTTSNSPSYF